MKNITEKNIKDCICMLVLMITLASCTPISGPQSISSPTPVTTIASRTSTNTSSPFTPIQRSNWTSFTNANFVRALLVDRSGNLWSGGSGGVVQWNTKTGTYIKYTSDRGLASNFVTSIAQTSDGAMWFGTYGYGLSHFDGANWTTFTTQDGLVDDHVLSITAAPDDTVWVGTLNGVSHFDGHGWTSYTTEKIKGAPLGLADSIAIAQDGEIWIGGDWKTGLRRLAGQVSEDWNQALGSGAVTALSIAPDGTLWVGTQYGVAHYDGNDWQKYNLSKDELSAVSSIAVTPSGNVWVGFSVWMGFSQYDQPISTHAAEKGNPGQFSGVWHYDGSKWDLISTKDGLVDNEIRAISVGPDGRIWFGSATQGISSFDGRNWTTYQTMDGMLENAVMTVGISRMGELWFGHDIGVSRYDGQTWSIYQKIENMSLYNVTLKIDSDNSIWLGTSNGIAHFDGASWTTYPEKQYQFLNGINNIVTLSNNTHLFTSNGAVVFDGQHWSPFPELDQTIVLKAIQAPDGTLWFTTALNGVYSYNGSVWKNYTEADGLASNWVNDLAMAPDGILWVTSCYGLSQFDGKTWKIFSKENISADGLPKVCNSRSIVSDQTGSVWVSTHQGLMQIVKGKQTIYTTRDGLASDNINSISIGPDGAIWIATDAGVSRYFPPRP